GVVHQNLAFGIGFIVVMLVLSAMGLLSLILAAVLHFVAACIVIFNSARLVRFGEELHKPADAGPVHRVMAEPVPAS
ncbi:MAG: hypothetical protein ACYS5V_17815, partial [Planctomycetota bacterium]